MPIYLYRDKISGYEIEVVRSFDEYEIPPREEEILQALKQTRPGAESSDLLQESAQENEIPADKKQESYDWERLISAPLMASKWPSSGGPVKGRA